MTYAAYVPAHAKRTPLITTTGSLITEHADVLTLTAEHADVFTLTAEDADDREVNQPGPRPPPVVWIQLKNNENHSFSIENTTNR